MPDEPEPVELTEPTDVVAWLRALPVGTVLLDSSTDAWKLASFPTAQGAAPFVAFECTNDDYRYRLDDAVDMATMAAWRPFRVLWTPGGGQ